MVKITWKSSFLRKSSLTSTMVSQLKWHLAWHNSISCLLEQKNFDDFANECNLSCLSHKIDFAFLPLSLTICRFSNGADEGKKSFHAENQPYLLKSYTFCPQDCIVVLNDILLTNCLLTQSEENHDKIDKNCRL